MFEERKIRITTYIVVIPFPFGGEGVIRDVRWQILTDSAELRNLLQSYSKTSCWGL